MVIPHSTVVELLNHGFGNMKTQLHTCLITGLEHHRAPVICLAIVKYEVGVLRVNGRIRHSNVNFNCPTALLHYVRQRFWPVQGKATCRKVVHDCIKYFRVKPIGVKQLMGDLPKERVTPDFPFNCSGVDFCGPFLVKYKHQRKGTYHNVYVCLFVCLVTKAVHLEMVTDLTSDAFIACLKRFVARRGLCSKLFSDNGTNFIGANKELSKLYNLVVKPDDSLASYLSTEGIDWNFIPPRAPNFGGLWESGVKAFKYHFKRILGNSKLSYEEFLTVITQIEGILNSRPLAPLSSDTDVYDVLTPAHFLIGRSLNTVVEPNLIEVKDNRLSNWKKLTKLIQMFWRKWHIQYLNNLQQRSKWKDVPWSQTSYCNGFLRNEFLPGWSVGHFELPPSNQSTIRKVQQCPLEST
ncbi:uncharacterized protein LOC129984956 [Argiope bruennichi]|uniref:uncharacterized protein LOC129984956 n=1 Tax=Argiope bruennichi TaxID=94029 RepID=UPI00249514CB|nr:uncharacterized protein LOC129984956 [Argiope bruennichi]